ncbi:MAG: S41 family peptidase [bacterium]|nr:S41 family peptidase [bacterium]
MTNEGSASASEIVTAYLKNYAGAKVVGKKTYGKGVVQNLTPLNNGGELHLTISEYLVGPNFVKVDGVGVSPDYEVNESTSAVKEEDSLQLKKAIEVAEEMLKQK